ncbi:hypothetical protein ES319_D06G233800v1 [Gossypium barbadense]|uniref:Late embryogenesis abundant protein LEA-2 subgroup domain-containing protein n=2 Tax=Gossypium TaxID=3633 RepID=A0A5J5RCX3_GOSBA|nr:hypothetical protein ES319_D06G233800v1 [Gossypium barbadense]TYG66175.1 hypothetical protein ES288_D06G246600v1 [Gossypium darwinii]
MKDTVFPSSRQATNGGAAAAKPSFPATKSQLYGATRPLYRPQPKPHRYRRSCCCSCCIWTTVAILILLLLAGVSAAILTLIYSPHRPTFTVSSLKVSILKIMSSSKLITNITLNVNAKNPNKELIYIYDPIAISLTTKNDVVMANGSFGPFVHGTKNNTLLKATISGGSQELDDSSAGELRVALKNKKGLLLKMKLDTKVKARIGGLKTPKVGIRVICEGIKVTVPNGKSPSKASISNAKCKVDLRVKVWRWTF